MDTERHSTVIKLSVFQENIAILNLHSPNNRAKKYAKEKIIEVKGEMDKKSKQ